MQSIGFYGASGMVTGSNFVLSNGGEKLMVDLGMFQGSVELDELNEKELGFEVSRLTGALVTHAHLDHVGRLPLLVKAGYKAELYMTKATKVLAEIVLRDSANIAEQRARREGVKAMYTKNEAEEIISKMRVIEFGKPFSIGGFRVVAREAGHILGSASFEVLVGGKRVVFGGDLGNSPSELIRPTQMIEAADVVVMESTYGDRNHPKQNSDELVAAEINAVEQSGGTLLVPSFSIERTQVILHKIDHLKREGKVAAETKVFLDSPMGIRATRVYEESKDLYNEQLAEHAKLDNPFEFPGLSVVGSARESEGIVNIRGAKVIVAGSGMMSGGRIMNHAIDFLPDPRTRLMIVGFQAQGTVGRAIKDGASEVEIYGKKVLVGAHVSEVLSLSAHADQDQLMNWIGEIDGVKSVFLVHGEDGPREVLAEKIRTETRVSDVAMPRLDEVVDLG